MNESTTARTFHGVQSWAGDIARLNKLQRIARLSVWKYLLLFRWMLDTQLLFINVESVIPPVPAIVRDLSSASLRLFTNPFVDFIFL